MAVNVNQVDDDLNNLAASYLNQYQNVLPAGSGVPTSISTTGTATGTVASPGLAGVGGSERPGKRLFNPLSKLASYTYQISWYMITPDAYSEFVNSGRRNIDALKTAGPVSDANPTGAGAGAYLIAQSGGINNKVSRRAPGFELDYYIDQLKFNTFVGAKGTGTSTTTISDVTFQVTEPYGFSFLTNLKRAADALKAYTDSTSYKNLSNNFKNIFILGIRFYGYDINGNLIKPSDSLYGAPIDPAGSDALFENFYDIEIANVKFRLDGKVVVYNIEAMSINAHALLGVKRGRIPTGVKVQGKSVNDALQGLNGLITKLNEMELAKVNKSEPDASIPNKYKIVYQGDAESRIGMASMVTQSDLDKIKWPGSGAKNTTESTDAKGAKPPDPNERMIIFNNDVSIIQAIEQVIKRSTYMENALKTVYANTKEPDIKQKNNPQVKRDNPLPLAWFSVSSEIVKCEWDQKISDWAYEQNFIISVYEIPSVQTPYAPDSTKYYGPHKRYDYFFTGQNSEILEYNLQFDNLYFNTVLGIESKDFVSISRAQNPGAEREGQEAPAGGSGSSTGNTKTTSGNTGQKTDAPPPGAKDSSAGTATAGGTSVKTGVKSKGDRTGTLAVGLEVQNSIVTSLHDVGAYANGKLRILGDPDFLIRDAATSIASLYNKFYDTDGYTISANGGQIFIEVAFKEAVDYKNSTGLMQINENIFFLNYPQYIKDMTQGAVIWEVTDVISSFTGGRFEQTLTLVGPAFDTGEPGTDSSAATSSSGTTTAQTAPQDDDLKPLDQPEPLKNLDDSPRGG
jgi:hypothetical protein